MFEAGDHLNLKFAKLICGFVRQAAQGDSGPSAPGGAAGGGGSAQVYRDAEDAATIPESNDLKVSAGATATCLTSFSKQTCLRRVCNFLLRNLHSHTCPPNSLRFLLFQ